MKSLLRMMLGVVPVLLFLDACGSIPVNLQCYSPPHQVVESLSATMLWSKLNVKVIDEESPMVVAISDRIFVEMYDESNPIFSGGYDIAAFETITGNLVWSKLTSPPSLLATNGSILYNGTYNKVDLLDGNTGEILQTLRLTGGGNIISLQVNDSNVYAYTNSGRSFAYSAENKSISATEPNFIAHLFLDRSIIYIDDEVGLKAMDTDTQSIIWQTDFDRGIGIASLVFTDNIIFSRDGQRLAYPSDLYATDRKTGKLLWKKELDVIGNIEAKGSELYVLTIDGYLLILDQETGQELKRIEFLRRPFVVYEPNNILGGYYVAVDQSNNIVVVALGDSCQLLALQLIQ